ncbi:hypothetical protein [Clostridium sp.]|uniref:hypothetical protein n=1 Tax=Clostridium sp. TaxID=1506 RepID=UPI003D6D9575
MMNEIKSMDNVLLNLNWGFMSLQQYDEIVKFKKFKWIKGYEISQELHTLYPNPPSIHDSKSIRVGTADTIFKIAHVNSSKITQEVLDTLHSHIFDCSAAFRLALVQSLLCVGNSTSLAPIQQLLTVEKESMAIRNTCEIVLYKILNSKKFLDAGTFIYVGDLIDGAADGDGKMYYKYNGQLIYEGAFKSNRFHGLGLYYDDYRNIQNKGRFLNGEFIG